MNNNDTIESNTGIEEIEIREFWKELKRNNKNDLNLYDCLISKLKRVFTDKSEFEQHLILSASLDKVLDIEK